MTRRKTPTPSPATEAEHARDYAAIALAYAKAAVADKKQRKHCKFVRQATQRHLDDLKRSRSKDYPYRYDEWHANDICDFVEKLPHVEGAWETPNLTLEPVQIFILATIFGWRDKVTGLRRFTDVYIEMARKGAKSTLTAGVVLYCACCEDEPGPLILVGATTGAQALKVFKPARLMALRSPALQEAFGLQVWAKAITIADNGGEIQTINSKGSTQDGHNPHMAVLDELHAHKDRALFDVIHSADGSRRNPLYWKITTAGFFLQGVCFEQRTYAAKVLSKAIAAEHFFAIIFTLDGPADFTPERKVGDDPYDERNWVKANPLMPVTPSLAAMRRLATAAKASPGSEGEFFTKRLNKWMGAATAWLNVTQWIACTDTSLSIDDFRGLDCYIGADLSNVDDLSALVLAAIDEKGRLLVKTWFYCPRARLESADATTKQVTDLYRLWAKEKHLTLTEGNFIDHRVIEQQIRELKEQLAVRKATFDQWNSGLAMASRLNEDFDDGGEAFAAQLGKNANNHTDPAKEIEARVKAGPGHLRHDGNPVMTWCVGNAVVDRRVNGSLLPKKETPNSPNKIDGVDAMVNATAPMLLPEDEGQDLGDFLANAVTA
ncbi:terminase large subunit [Sphingomonas histidinilytica]|uniref:terminase large subunit n=1 Tax=Rhizorhabdus histidinilytica TaxID=439228 RepID=UPI001AD9C1FB|nr:terminase TerL endonuclease subunit [Rhizorhabdus histidinilytica]MBO9377685.1 terminase large subunit [Rhizorhabdus histidinilytica]